MERTEDTSFVLGEDVSGMFRMRTNTGIKQIIGWFLLLAVLAFCASVISQEVGRPQSSGSVLGSAVLGVFALFFLVVSVALIRSKPGISFDGFRVLASSIESGTFKVALADMASTSGRVREGIVHKGQWQQAESFSSNKTEVSLTIKQTGMSDAEFQFYGLGVLASDGRSVSIQVPVDP